MEESKLKRCSTSSTHAEAADEATDPLQKNRELETEVNSRKKQKQEEETTEKKKKKECCFDTKDANGNDDQTIYVTGFDTSGSRDEIRSALVKHFSSCGELERVFVPIECETGVSRGHAFINLQNHVEMKAGLALNGSYLGGRKLVVKLATLTMEFACHVNFKGCEICRAIFAAARRERYKRFFRTNGGKVERLSPEYRRKSRLHYQQTMASRKMKMEDDSKSNLT